MSLRYIGTILRTHGTDGSVFVSEAPPTLYLPPNSTIHIGFSGQFAKPYKLASLRPAQRGVLMSFAGITSPESAAALREEGVFVEDALLRSGNADEFTIGEILDCTVIEQSTGKHLGTITDVWIMPANDVWVLTTTQGDIPLPVIDDVVKLVDIPHKRIEIELIAGLRELATGGDDVPDEN